jgi:hypothetical protein
MKKPVDGGESLLMKNPVLVPVLVAPTVPRAMGMDAASCVENPFLDAPEVDPWERKLLRDCPTSALGNVQSFSFSSANSSAAAHFVLGLKALHNFMYDLCKYEFDLARAIEPTLFLAAWGRALCNSRQIWNAEDTSESLDVLEAARRDPAFPGSMSAREQDYFASAMALNLAPNGTKPPVTPEEARLTRPIRYAAYLAAVSAIAARHPADETAKSFTVLASLAVGSVGVCAREPRNAYCVTMQEQARVLSAAAYEKDANFSGTLQCAARRFEPRRRVGRFEPRRRVGRFEPRQAPSRALPRLADALALLCDSRLHLLTPRPRRSIRVEQLRHACARLSECERVHRGTALRAALPSRGGGGHALAPHAQPHLRSARPVARCCRGQQRLGGGRRRVRQLRCSRPRRGWAS